MSVAFRGKSGGVEGDSRNLVAMDDRSNNGWRSRSSMIQIVAAVVCFGFLLLTLILVAKNASAINQWEAKYNKLVTEFTKDRDNMTVERDLLKILSSNLTREMEDLQRNYKSAVASRDELQKKVNVLKSNTTGRPCLQGWRKFNNKCYYSSRSGDSKTWLKSRNDCQSRGADLAIITTEEELDFVKRDNGITWIGLTRVGDKWEWVDGTELVGGGFWQPDEPNNFGGNEDCVEVSRDASAWNDAPCDRKFSWTCEDSD